MFVLADLIKGGKKKVWRWQLPADIKKSSVKFTNHGFTITQGNAVLKATFIKPTKLAVEINKESFSMVPKKDHSKKTKTFAINAINAVNADDDTRAISWSSSLLMSKTPEVIGKAGSPTTITVGEQMIMYDKDGKITISK